MLRTLAMQVKSWVSAPGAARMTSHPALPAALRDAMALRAPALASRRAWTGASPSPAATPPRAPRAAAYGSSMPASSPSGSYAIEEVDFSPQVANSVSVMGTVGADPEITVFESGKVANLRLAFTDRKGGATQWFNVDAWDDLADAVKAGVFKGDRVVVEGRLKVDSWTDRATQQERKSLKIQASAVKRIRGGMGGGGGGSGGSDWQPRSAPQQQQQSWENGTQVSQSSYNSASSASPSASSGGGATTTTEEQWMSFFEDRSAWYDNRPRKTAGEISANAPDFKRREGGRESPALWITGRTTPRWVHDELARLEGGAGGAAQATGYPQEPPPF
jgi:single-strand DNA-binding protein